MQPFSLHNFTAAKPGYDQHWYDTALLLKKEPAPQSIVNWVQQPLPRSTEPEKVFDLGLLKRFYQHPIRYFFNTRLGIRIPFEDVSEDEETFSLQGLQKWAIVGELADGYLDGESLDRSRFSARGMLPHGSAANSEWYTLLNDYQDLFENLSEFRERPSEPKTIECQLDNGRLLYGEIGQFYSGVGLMHFSASKSIKARSLISLWLDHLALCAAQQLSPLETSQLLAPGTRGFRFVWLDAAMAGTLLADYVDLLQQGLDYPLPVFPDTSYAWALAPDPETAMSKALLAWKGSSFGSAFAGECDDGYIRLALHNNTTNPLNDTLFQQCARRIYQPAIDNGGSID